MYVLTYTKPCTQEVYQRSYNQTYIKPYIYILFIYLEIDHFMCIAGYYMHMYYMHIYLYIVILQPYTRLPDLLGHILTYLHTTMDIAYLVNYIFIYVKNLHIPFTYIHMPASLPYLLDHTNIMQPCT